jgi:ketopantoate reductase
VHVAVVGAGALGRVYGVRLARVANEEVTFVVRDVSPAASEPGTRGASARAPFVLERVDQHDDVLRLDAPAVATEVPRNADLVLVCVRGEQLGAELEALLARGPDAPAVVLTPMMPGDYDRLRAALGTRVIAAMPGVVAYTRADGIVRYWLPRVAPTLIETQDPPRDALRALERALERAGMRARHEEGVHASNPATTATFVPLAMALDVAGGVDALLADGALVELALRAADEGRALAQRIGKVAGWAAILTKFVGKTTLKLGVGLAKRQAPEAVFYVEEHFGRKLHAQNVAMARAMVALAARHGTARAALSELTARLESRP